MPIKHYYTQGALKTLISGDISETIQWTDSGKNMYNKTFYKKMVKDILKFLKLPLEKVKPITDIGNTV